MTSYRRWNILTDLTYIETFYERQSDGTLVKAAIPDAGIDFTIDYFTDGATHFKASRIDGVYKDCRQVDEYSLEVFIPLSRRRMWKHNLRRLRCNEKIKENSNNIISFISDYWTSRRSTTR